MWMDVHGVHCRSALVIAQAFTELGTAPRLGSYPYILYSRDRIRTFCTSVHQYCFACACLLFPCLCECPLRTPRCARRCVHAAFAFWGSLCALWRSVGQSGLSFSSDPRSEAREFLHLVPPVRYKSKHSKTPSATASKPTPTASKPRHHRQQARPRQAPRETRLLYPAGIKNDN